MDDATRIAEIKRRQGAIYSGLPRNIVNAIPEFYLLMVDNAPADIAWLLARLEEQEAKHKSLAEDLLRRQIDNAE